VRLAIVPLSLSALALGACDAKPSSPTSVEPSASGAAAAFPKPEPPAAIPTPSPRDLDVDALKKKLACAGDIHRQTCRILNEFGDASRFAPQIPSGEGRWIGNAYTLEKTSEKSALTLLSASQVPTSLVPPGELALKIGIGPLPDDKHDHGVKLVNALAHGDTVSKLNQAAPYVKAWTPSAAQGSMATSETSVRLVADEVYLRQTSTKVLMVRVKSSATGTAITVAELWPSSW